jgi:hypothetical protein
MPLPRLWPGEKIPVLLGERGLQFIDHTELCAKFSRNAITHQQLEGLPPHNGNPVYHGCSVCGSTRAVSYSKKRDDHTWWCVECRVNDFVDHKGGSLYQPGTRVLLHGLARTELNGREGVLLAPTQREETELRGRRRIKVGVGTDTLSLRLASVMLGELVADPVADTELFSIRSTTNAGLGMFARTAIRHDDIVLIDHPLATIATSPLRWMNHPECGPLLQQVMAYGETHNGHLEGAEAFPPEALTLMDQVKEIQAIDAFSRLSMNTQRRWMVLHGTSHTHVHGA